MQTNEFFSLSDATKPAKPATRFPLKHTKAPMTSYTKAKPEAKAILKVSFCTYLFFDSRQTFGVPGYQSEDPRVSKTFSVPCSLRRDVIHRSECCYLGVVSKRLIEWIGLNKVPLSHRAL